MSNENIIYEKRGHIAYITLNRNERLNAIDPPMQRALWGALLDFKQDEDAWVVILTGAGDRSFCAGNDLKWRYENPDEPYQWDPFFRSNPDKPGPPGTLPTELWKPMIAAVNGYAVGGGMEITMACDVIIASENAQFGTPEIRNAGAYASGGGILRLPRQIPYRIAMWMVLSGELMSAQEMYRVGYVNEVVPQDKLMETAERYASILCENPPIGVQASKEVALRALDLPIDTPPTAWMYQWAGVTARMRASEDAEESRRAWVEKRKPVYRNR